MKSSCCTIASEKWKDVVDCNVKEDEEGILVSIRAKNPENTNTLKEFFRSSQKLFGNSGCC